MEYVKIIIFICSTKLTIGSYVRPDEKLMRVSSPEEAHGELYFLDSIGLAKKYGYNAVQHYVTTEDGYILEIFRICSSSSIDKFEGKPVVLLEHGLMATSDSFAFFSRSLAYLLVNSGYDVWLGNSRGNTYGRLHTSLSPEDSLFWNFTFHEIGRIDYAAKIDYILHLTNKTTLTLIGHSMGGTGLVVLLSERPEYNKKINIAVAVAPAVYWKKIDPIRLIILKVLYLFKNIIDPTGMTEFLPQSHLTSRLLDNICQKFDAIEWCLQLFGLLPSYTIRRLKQRCSIRSNHLPQKELVTVANYYPTGTSAKSIWHYCQGIINKGKFRQYDYGNDNIQYYGQSEPPEYEVSNIVTNLVIFYADNDHFCTKEDVEELTKRVSTNAILERIKNSKFSHLDFVVAENIKTLFHNRLLEIIYKYRD